MSATWIWLIVALVCIVIEVGTATFTFLFFGVGALVVVACRVVGLDSWMYESIVFGVISVLSLALLRGKLVAALQTYSKDFKSDVDQEITVGAAIAPKSEGSVEYQGSQWTAVNESDLPIASGSKARIVRISGVKLFLEPKIR